MSKPVNKHLQRRFFAAFKKAGTICGACRLAEIDRETVRRWRKDADFEREFQGMDLDITETLEASALERALKGDTILTIFLLKARAPEKYRDNHRVEHSGQLTVSDIVLELPRIKEKRAK